MSWNPWPSCCLTLAPAGAQQSSPILTLPAGVSVRRHVFKGSIPWDCSPFRHQQKVPGPQATCTSVRLGYKFRGSHNHPPHKNAILTIKVCYKGCEWTARGRGTQGKVWNGSDHRTFVPVEYRCGSPQHLEALPNRSFRGFVEVPPCRHLAMGGWNPIYSLSLLPQDCGAESSKAWSFGQPSPTPCFLGSPPDPLKKCLIGINSGIRASKKIYSVTCSILDIVSCVKNLPIQQIVTVHPLCERNRLPANVERSY